MITSINEYRMYMEKSVKKADRIDIYRDNNFVVVRPLTHKASCKYGAFTSWCISVPGEEYIWEESKDVKGGVIFIIQRQYNITPEKQNYINRLIDLNSDYMYNGFKSDEDKHEFNVLMNTEEALDLSKIAIVYNGNGRIQSIWDKNNMDITDVYDRNVNNLPIPSVVANSVTSYIIDVTE